MSKRALRKVSARLKADVQHYRQAAETYDALNSARIGSHLPSNQEEYKTAEHHYELCDDTRRRGAGPIQSGGVILRPGGMANYREFHDLYTREEEKKPDKKAINLHEAAKTAQYNGPQMRVIAFPDTMCILCLKAIAPNRAGCNGGNRFFPDCKCCAMLDITTVDHAIDNGRIMPGDAIRSSICPSCKCQITAMQRDNSNLRAMADGREVPMWVLKQRLIYESLEKNWKTILHNARLEPIEGKQGVRVMGMGGA